MEIAQTRMEVINVNVKLDVKNMKMERIAQKTLLNALLILVEMEIAQIQRAVSTAFATRAGRQLEIKLVQINLSLVSCDKIHAYKFQVVQVHY